MTNLPREAIRATYVGKKEHIEWYLAEVLKLLSGRRSIRKIAVYVEGELVLGSMGQETDLLFMLNHADKPLQFKVEIVRQYEVNGKLYLAASEEESLKRAGLLKRKKHERKGRRKAKAQKGPETVPIHPQGGTVEPRKGSVSPPVLCEA